MGNPGKLVCAMAGFGAFALLAVPTQADSVAYTRNFVDTTVFTNSPTMDPPGIRQVFPLTFPQFQQTRAALTRVVVNYHFDFELTLNIPAEGGGGSVSMSEGLFGVNGVLFGNFGGGGGGGGAGPQTVVVPFTVPSGAPGSPPVVGEFIVDADSNPEAFAQFAGGETALVTWDAPFLASWFGGPGGSVSLAALSSSYITVTYEFDVSCQDGYSWADADRDGDVDQTDFGAWQTCFGALSVLGLDESLICRCLDHDGVDGVTASDLEAFVNCWSGPAVPADPNCAG